MKHINRESHEREVAAQDEARHAAQAEWQAKYGDLSHEEYMQKLGEEFRAEIEAPRDTFSLAYTVLVTDDPEQAAKVHEFAEALQEETPGEPRPDTIELTLQYETGLKEAIIPTEGGEKTVLDVQKMSFSAKVLLYPIGNGGKNIGLAISQRGRFYRLGIGGMLAPTIYNQVVERNNRLGYVMPPELLLDKKIIANADDFSIHTSQEMDTLSRAQCNGKTFAGYLMNDQAGAITYEQKGLSHKIQLALTEEDRTAGLALTYLENLVRSQDADAMIATSYILRVLAPPPHLPARPYAGGWINFDEVIRKIGWYPQTTKDRRKMHARIWEFIKFGERAHIIGKRTGAKYKDGEGNEIDTTIHGAAWRVMKTETPDPLSLYAALEIPVRAEIVVSKELTALISNPKTAQYLGYAEILGAIPGGKPAGAWARVIGAALMNFWRRNPRETIAGTLQPTRRELLDHYTAKGAPYEEIIESNDPARAIDYWCGGLQILANEGFIERTGEAAISAKEMKNSLPRKNWQNLWLDQMVNIEPSLAKLKPEVAERAKALPETKPRDLKKKPRAPKRPKSQ